MYVFLGKQFWEKSCLHFFLVEVSWFLFGGWTKKLLGDQFWVLLEPQLMSHVEKEVGSFYMYSSSDGCLPLQWYTSLDQFGESTVRISSHQPWLTWCEIFVTFLRLLPDSWFFFVFFFMISIFFRLNFHLRGIYDCSIYDLEMNNLAFEDFWIENLGFGSWGPGFWRKSQNNHTYISRFM